MIEYRATPETATSVIEAQAAAARALFAVLHPAESWDEISGLADQKQTPALARQAVFMRAARNGLEAYARYAAGIRHRNPLSLRERTLVAQVWTEVVITPEPFALKNAARLASVQIARYDAALSQTVATGGRGAVAAMIRDYSRAMVRLASLTDGL